jgi:hypothetical protein
METARVGSLVNLRVSVSPSCVDCIVRSELIS